MKFDQYLGAENPVHRIISYDFYHVKGILTFEMCVIYCVFGTDLKSTLNMVPTQKSKNWNLR